MAYVRLTCASAQSDQSLRWALKASYQTADVRIDLNLRCTYIAF